MKSLLINLLGVSIFMTGTTISANILELNKRHNLRKLEVEGHRTKIIKIDERKIRSANRILYRRYGI